MVDEKRTLEIDDEKIDRLFEEYQKQSLLNLEMNL